MKFNTQLKLTRHKKYFDTGLSITNYFKYVIALFGIASQNVKYTIIIALIYAILSYFLGWWYLKSGFFKAEIEVGNQYNLFVAQMRKKRNI